MVDQRTLKVSENKRFLQWNDGQPFFYLADTAWELFHRLTLAEAATYLKKRAAQGFTLIQCVLLAECDGLRVPNRNGDLPLIDMDPTKPNPAYFDHVEKVLTWPKSLVLYWPCCQPGATNGTSTPGEQGQKSSLLRMPRPTEDGSAPDSSDAKSSGSWGAIGS